MSRTTFVPVVLTGVECAGVVIALEAIAENAPGPLSPEHPLRSAAKKVEAAWRAKAAEDGTEARA